MPVSENIRKRRLELGISQQQLAVRMGYKSRSTINKIEAGINDVTPFSLSRFAKALDTTEDFLLTGKDSSEYISRNVSSKKEKQIALILAGGRSTRNLQNIPNQFINVAGKPVIIYVLETYQHHPAIDEIYVVCLKGWEKILSAYAEQYGISKLKKVFTGGESGVLSAENGISSISADDNDIIIIQESTRPLVTEEIISKLINSTETSAVVVEPMNDNILFLNEDSRKKYLDRNALFLLQSPEAYRYGMLKEMFAKAHKNNHIMDESCCAMLCYNLGYNLNFVEGNHTNIKVVRQEDLSIITALLD